MIFFKCTEGIEDSGMKRESIEWDSSEKLRFDHEVCQSVGRVGIWVGM